MSETVIENAVQEVTADAETLGDAGKKALEAERRNARAAAKERDALAAKLKEFEDRDKSAADLVTEKATQAEQRAVKAESDLLRLTVAMEKGLTTAQAKRLVGATREELEADAAELLETFKPAEKAEQEPAKVPDLDLGMRSGTAKPLNPVVADLQQIEADLAAQKRR